MGAEEQQQAFNRAAEEITAKCACRSWDAIECFRFRYPPPIDDFGREEWENSWEREFDKCECGCHSELDELERDIYGDDDFL